MNQETDQPDTVIDSVLGFPAAKPTRWDRTIAVLEIVGGALGVVMSVWLVVLSRADPTISAIFLGPNAAAVYAGILLWRGNERGYRLSMVIQVAQLIRVSSQVFFFEFVLGAAFTVGLTNRGFFIFPKYGTVGLIGPADHTYPLQVGVNLVALAAFLYLWLRWRKLRKLPAAQGVAEVGSADQQE